MVTGRGRSGPRALVIVPTHDHASTLDLAVASALSQTVGDLDIVIVGDGVGDDTRRVANELVDRDHRVRYVDRPKSPSRNENTRHELIMDTDADIVTYLGDDDLFLPDHVETMGELLQSNDFAHPFPVILKADGRLEAYPTDLSDERCAQWHLQHGFNTIGLTGASHTVAFYRSLPNGWTEPPPGWWSDQFFWTQILCQPGVRLATARRCTVIKHPATNSHRTSDERRSTLLSWSSRIESSDFDDRFQSMVADAIRMRAVDEYRVRTLHERAMESLIDELRSTGERAVSLALQLDGTLADLDRTRIELAEARFVTEASGREIDTIRATRTWRSRHRLLASPIGALARRVFARSDVLGTVD